MDKLGLDIPSEVLEGLELVKQRIESLQIDEFVINDLYLPSTHLLRTSGKMIRPMMVLLGARVIGEKIERFVDLASAIELLHVSSLVHDDIVDKERMRRNMESVNMKFGGSSALLAGDALISKGIQLSSKYGSNVIYAIASATMDMCAGEVLDFKYKNKKSALDINVYIKIAQLKTASLIGLSGSIAAIAKGASVKRELYEYGKNLGIAFQIRDDVSEFLETTDPIGKRRVRSEANIVNVLKKEVKEPIALQKAKEMNSLYINRALKEVSNLELSKILTSYANIIRI